MKTILFTLFGLAMTFQAQATHLVGGSINYRHLTGNSYEVTATLYRDCSGIPAPTSINLTAASSCGNISFQLDSINMDTLEYCNGLQNTCNGGSLPGVEWVHYMDTVQFTACTDWLISYELCCRNMAQNISNSMSESYYLETTLNNSGASNSSAVFNQSLNLVAEVNQPFCVNNNAFDMDGDSLVYSLINPRGTNGNSVAFNSGYTASNPMGSGTNFSFNTASGNFCFTPNTVGNFVAAIRVDEYRNGSIVGSTVRDFQISVVNGVAISSQDINGTLFDNSGNPVSGATIELLDYGISQGTLNTVATQTTNGSGNFSFASQNVGQYLVRAQPTGAQLPTYHQSTAYWQYAQMIYSLCDAQVTANITYVDPNNPIGTGVISGYLNGTGVFRAGDPVEGVNILLYDLQTEELVQNSITNQDGFYELQDVPAGSYYILVDAEGLGMISTHFIDIQEGELIEEANFFANEDGVIASGEYQSQGFVSFEDASVVTDFNLFPNPGSDQLNITSQSGEAFTVKVFGVSGRKVLDVKEAESKHELEVQALQSGTYIVVLQRPSSSVIIKWIKK